MSSEVVNADKSEGHMRRMLGESGALAALLVLVVLLSITADSFLTTRTC